MAAVNNTVNKRLRRRKGARKTISPAIPFGAKSTVCLGIFVIIYAIFMVCFQPMLKDETKAQKFKMKKDKFLRKQHELVGKVKKEGRAWKDEFKELNKFRGKTRVKNEVDMMDSAWDSLVQKKTKSKTNTNTKTKTKTEVHDDIDVDVDVDVGVGTNNINNDNSHHKEGDKPTTGFMVLGMHRSGTSMLSGLLVEGFGYKVGKPLIGAAFDNEKGFFELVPAVLQNDEWMYNQGVNWAGSLQKYDAERALAATKKGEVKTKNLDNALAVLNDPQNIPWMQKDPRMCITMRTWLPYLNSKPAVIFTYRHPLEVALSLFKREVGFTVTRGLRLWIIYNKQAILNSADLCRVLSSNNAVLADPLKETERIAKELEETCGVPAPPSRISQHVIDSFVDPKLQHNKRALEDEKQSMAILEMHGSCEVRDYKSVDGGEKNPNEVQMYKRAMKVYCDLEDGKAYESDYEWPTL